MRSFPENDIDAEDCRGLPPAAGRQGDHVPTREGVLSYHPAVAGKLCLELTGAFAQCYAPTVPARADPMALNEDCSSQELGGAVEPGLGPPAEALEELCWAQLRRDDQSVTEVCLAVSCSSLGTFRTRFTELVGMSPGADRRQARRASARALPCIPKQVSRPVRNREAPAAPPLLP